LPVDSIDGELSVKKIPDLIQGQKLRKIGCFYCLEHQAVFVPASTRQHLLATTEQDVATQLFARAAAFPSYRDLSCIRGHTVVEAAVDDDDVSEEANPIASEMGEGTRFCVHQHDPEMAIDSSCPLDFCRECNPDSYCDIDRCVRDVYEEGMGTDPSIDNMRLVEDSSGNVEAVPGRGQEVPADIPSDVSVMEVQLPSSRREADTTVGIDPHTSWEKDDFDVNTPSESVHFPLVDDAPDAPSMDDEPEYEDEEAE